MDANKLIWRNDPVFVDMWIWTADSHDHKVLALSELLAKSVSLEDLHTEVEDNALLLLKTFI